MGNMINKIREELERNIGKDIAIKEKTFRGKSKVYKGKIDGVYRSFFNISSEEAKGSKATNYASILTGDTHIIIGYKHVHKEKLFHKPELEHVS